MTTPDPFTEAARAEAEAVMSEARERVGITVQEQARYIEGRVAGAEWARTLLAAQEPTDPTALQERIRRARSLPAEWARRRDGETTTERIERWQNRQDEQTAALIAAEVQAAKAAAWDEGCAAAEQYYKRTAIGVPGGDPIPAPLSPYETGDRA